MNSLGQKIESIENFANFNSTYLIVEFNLDQESDNYQRSAYTFNDMFGLIGGIYTIFTAASSFFLSFITQRIMMNSLLSELYLVEDKNKIINKETKFDILNLNIKASSVLPKLTSTPYKGECIKDNEKEEI